MNRVFESSFINRKKFLLDAMINGCKVKRKYEKKQLMLNKTHLNMKYLKISILNYLKKLVTI